MRRRAGGVAAVALTAATLVLAARQVTLLVIDVPPERATLLVKRSASLGMGLIESEQTVCDRQGPGSPLVSLNLPMSFCPLALAQSPAIRGSNVLLRLPFSRVLQGWVGAPDAR